MTRRKLRKNLLGFKWKFKATWYLWTGRYKYWTLLSVEEKELNNLITNQHFEIQCLTGVHEYVMYKIIKEAASTQDENDMILQRINFEYGAEQAGYSQSN